MLPLIKEEDMIQGMFQMIALAAKPGTVIFVGREKLHVPKSFQDFAKKL